MSVLVNKTCQFFDTRIIEHKMANVYATKISLPTAQNVMCKIAWSVGIPKECWGTTEECTSWPEQSCTSEYPKKNKVANRQPAARGTPYQEQDIEVTLSVASLPWKMGLSYQASAD